MELPSSKIKKFLIFQGMGLSNSSIKKFLIFSQKKDFLIFRDMVLSYILGKENPEKVFYISGKGTFLYFGKRKPRKSFLYFKKRDFYIFQEVLFRAQKRKRTLSEKASNISVKWNFLAPSLKNFLYFRKKYQSPKNKQKICFEEISCVL